jgi:hypothetical protein
MIPKPGDHLKVEETTRVVVGEQPWTITLSEPSGASSRVSSSKDTIITDVSKILVELHRQNRALTFEGPDWIRQELCKVGFASLSE